MKKQQKEIKAYYEKLFNTEGVKEEEKVSLLKQIKTKLGEEDKKRGEEEIKKAITELNRNKSPGIEGLGNEF